MMVAYAIFGMENYQNTQRYIDEDGGPPNLALSEEVLPYARNVMILYSVGRVILFLTSLKYPQVSKSFLYYEVLKNVIEAFLPYDITFKV